MKGVHLKSLIQSEAFHKAVILLGALGACSSIVMGWGGLDFIINVIVRKMMRLIPGSTLWETWKTIPIPVYIKFYIFNITNPDEFANGAKPKVTELGPFVYLVDFEKYDFSKNESIDTVFYSPSRTYIFQKDKSKGREEDLVTYINVIFVAVSHIAHGFTDIDAILETLDGMLTESGERLTRTDRVIDLLFNGVSIQPYIDLVNDPLVQQAGGVELPEDFKDGLFALFKGKNGTKDGIWECHTGTRDSSELARLHSYNGKTKLNLYKGDSCNAINGTDGTLIQPFIEPGVTPLYIFIPELCRSLQWEFLGKGESQGIPIAKYRFPPIQTVQENPNMWCFCPEDDPLKCDQRGIANLAACFGGAPLLYSNPHFLEANSSIRNLVDGLRPKKELHESRLDVNPLTGAAVKASIKMQFSIEVVPWPAMPSFAQAPSAIVPLAWVELVAALDGVSLVAIKGLSLLLKLWPLLRWLGVVGSLGLVFVGTFFVYRGRKANMAVNPATDELELDEVDTKVWKNKFSNNNDLKIVNAAPD